MCSIPCRLLFASAEGNSCAQLGVQWMVEFGCCHFVLVRILDVDDDRVKVAITISIEFEC